MARIKLEVNREELANQVRLAEESNTFKSRDDLYAHIANTDWAKSQPKPLTKSVVYLRIKEFNIPINTAKAEPFMKRVLNNVGILNNQEGQEERERFDKEDVELNKTMMAGYFDPKHHATIKKAVRGSMKAAIRLKCLDCCAENKVEIKECNVTTCPLWLYRPFQG